MTACDLGKLRRRGLQPALCALVATLALLAACQDRRPLLVLAPASGKPVKVVVEVADTPDTQTRGLMYRKMLDPDHGMVFLFDAEAAHAFWMKNTSIPLDMIFIAHDGRVVGIHANAEPFSLRPI